jgi:trans-AT polyketide synthase/acyltransferase/oxidoreductase domain-containing protein
MSVYMFPGQGSQKKGMGGELFARFPDEVATANAIVGYSIEKLCLSDPDGNLNNTRYTQSALFAVNALHYLAIRETVSAPAYVIGHSLGEYNALHAAGVIDFAVGVELTMLRGRLMSEVREGGMAAVLGVCADDIRAALLAGGLNDVHIANLNAPTQTVISAAETDLAQAEDLLSRALGAVCVRLNVSGPFHSPIMEDARIELDRRLATIEFREPVIPAISNVNAKPYARECMRGLLGRQLTEPVRWMDAIRYLMGKGERDFIEVGPGQVLTQLVKRIARHIPLDSTTARSCDSRPRQT